MLRKKDFHLRRGAKRELAETIGIQSAGKGRKRTDISIILQQVIPLSVIFRLTPDETLLPATSVMKHLRVRTPPQAALRRICECQWRKAACCVSHIEAYLRHTLCTLNQRQATAPRASRRSLYTPHLSAARGCGVLPCRRCDRRRWVRLSPVPQH